jgi:hypothetical protein
VAWVDVLRLDTGETQLRIHADAPQSIYTVNEGCVSARLEEELLKELGSRTTGYFMREARCLGDMGPSTFQLGHHDRECYGTRGLSVDRAYSITMTIHLSSITMRTLRALSAEFKALLRTALKLAHQPAEKHEPERLKFLATVQPEQFRVDLRRYDLCMKLGLSYRLTALIEGFQEKAVPIPKGTLTRRLGYKVQGEDAVEESVKRIYLAIHEHHFRQRKGYARTIASESVPSSLAPFSCPTHGWEKCPGKGCGHFDAWFAIAERELPSAQTGQGVEVLTRTGEPYLAPRGKRTHRPLNDSDSA